MANNFNSSDPEAQGHKILNVVFRFTITICRLDFINIQERSYISNTLNNLYLETPHA